MHVFNSIGLLLLAGAALPALAGEHRHHGAHEHGVGRLDIAQEGVELAISLDGPAVNIVGFEHAPNSDEDHKTLDNALARLRDGAALFVFPSEAACRLVDADVETPLAEHEEVEAHHDDAHHEAHQDDRDDHEHEHEEAHEHEATHADIEAAWRFTCDRPDRLDRIDVRLFDAFPSTQRLQVQYITDKQQGAASLNAAQPELRF